MSLNEELAMTIAMADRLKTAMHDVNDYTELPSLCSLSEEASARLSHALADYRRSALAIIYWREKKSGRQL